MIRDTSGSKPVDDQLLVRVEACVAGGPELRALGDGATVAPGGAAVGVVESTGDAAGDFTGARVVVGPFDPCGECAVCRRGHAAVCPARVARGVSADGALATHVIARARWVCRLDGGLELPGPAAALLGREAAIAYAMYARLGVPPGEPVAVVGEGPIAALVIQLAAARSNRLVDLASPPAEPVRVFETTGTAAGRARALSLAGPGAQVAMVAPGATGAEASEPLPVDALFGAGASVAFVAGAHPDLIPEVAALAVKGELDLARVADVIDATALGELEARVHRGLTAGTVPIVVL
jgi:threonine dehydrogenase-like Zn-dependent dehydrogenase